MVSVDPKSLNVTDNFKISSKNIKFGEIAFVGSAHPVKHPETHNWVDFYGSSGMIKDATNISAYQMIVEDLISMKIVNQLQMLKWKLRHICIVLESLKII